MQRYFDRVKCFALLFIHFAWQVIRNAPVGPAGQLAVLIYAAEMFDPVPRTEFLLSFDVILIDWIANMVAPIVHSQHRPYQKEHGQPQPPLAFPRRKNNVNLCTAAHSFTWFTIDFALSQNITVLLTCQTEMGATELLSLTVEVLDMILEYIDDEETQINVSLVCRALHARMLPKLHRYLTVNVKSKVDLPRFFDTFKSFLSSYAKERLKNGYSLKPGRLTRSSYSCSNKDKQIPAKAECVQHLSLDVTPCDCIQYGKFGWLDLCRYIEATLPNLSNVRAVELNIITKPIASWLSSSKSLQALTILHDIHGNFSAPEEAVQQIQDCIDFQTLRQLAIAAPYANLLFKRILDADACNAGIFPALHTLEVEVAQETDTVLQFIAKINTLTSLTIRDKRPFVLETEQGSPFLPAILEHKKLETLRIPFAAKVLLKKASMYSAVDHWTEKGVPLSDSTVRAIVNGLPELRRVDFGPDTHNLVDSSKVVKKFACGFYGDTQNHRKLQVSASCTSDIPQKEDSFQLPLTEAKGETKNPEFMSGSSMP
ncbi:hypothetical protein PG985_005677 [Apiospora marii]|uniref:uncharacterized protein n=1 Tax=Apiospora marii TaxID=335849 RepID=UPI00312E69A8